MLCRHLVEKYLVEQRDAAVPQDTIDTPNAHGPDGEVVVEAIQGSMSLENIKLAELTISMLDEAMIATAVRAEAAALAAAAPVPTADTVTVMPTLSYAAATSIAPAPSASYVAGRVGTRPQAFTGARVQRNASLAPRRVASTGSQLPPVIVSMDGGRAVVQNQAEVAQARAAALNPVQSDGAA
jgi:hypothetical protein